MPVFTKDNMKVLFIHVPKTGGSSVEWILRQNGWKMDFHSGGGLNSWNKVMRCSPQHMHNEMLNTIFRLASFDLVIMIVRNPLDRIKSDFKWRIKNSLINSDIEYNDWIMDTLKIYKNNKFIYDNHIRPQIEFEVSNTKIFKLEDSLDHVLHYMEDEIGAEFLNKTIPKNMTSKSMIINKKGFLLDCSTRDELLDFYGLDIEKYGY